MKKIVGIIVAILITTLIVRWWWLVYQNKWGINFLDSTFLQNIIIFTIGILTLYIYLFIYLKGKQDNKESIARILISEIRLAEKTLNEINTYGAVTELSQVLPNNSRGKHAHLFMKDFDSDSITILNTFFNTCEHFQEQIVQGNSYLYTSTTEKAKLEQQGLFDLAMKHLADENKQWYEEDKKRFLKLFDEEGHTYHAVVHWNKISSHLSKLPIISGTTIMDKFKKIASVN